MSTPSALLLYKTETTEVRVFVAGVRNVEPTAGFWTQISGYSHFFKSVSAQTRVWKLSEADECWDVCSLAGCDVIFLFNYFKVRQVWRTSAAMKRIINHNNNNF